MKKPLVVKDGNTIESYRVRTLEERTRYAEVNNFYIKGSIPSSIDIHIHNVWHKIN